MNSQNKYTISGTITDSKTGEQLINVTVNNTLLGTGTVSNNYGFFSSTFIEGLCNLEFRVIGFKNQTYSFQLKADTFLLVELERGIEIPEVRVSGKDLRKSYPELSGLNQPQISLQTIESTPAILGEHDVLKTLQFLPGVKQGAESSAIFNVRGGSGDQNLVLLDGVPVYNVNHLLGFFSVFNTDAIKSVNFIKGGIPSRYGGRLSSVLDVSMKEGNLNKSSGVFSISPVAIRYTYESPIKKNKGAFILSFRRSFFDIPMIAYQKLIGENGSYGYYFYDINAKSNWIFNPSSRLYLSVYTGKDNQFSNTREDKNSKSQYKYRWGNITSVLRWNKIISYKLFSNTSLYYSRFIHDETGKVTDEKGAVVLKTSSELEDFCIQSDFDFYASAKYNLRFGTKLSLLIFNPNFVQVKSPESDIAFNDQNKTYSKQGDIFLENLFYLDKLNINAGIRFSAYSAKGRTYLNLQPRVAANLQITPNYQVSFSFTEMVQNLHQLSNSSLGMPTDIWIASTHKIGPQLADQVTLGFTRQFQNSVSFAVEGYYKWMNNVVRFDEGATFINPKELNWEEYILIGKGKAYGVEMMGSKEKGAFKGLISYTLSWSERKFDKLNHGDWFPFKYDRRHDVSVLAEYNFKEKNMLSRSVSLGFTLQSGNNLSIPNFEYEGIPTPGSDFVNTIDAWELVRQTYDNPNNFKMPVFHHLDLGYSTKKKKTDSKSTTWTFSIYNVYNRMNPWYYYKSGDQIKQVSFFPIFPSIGFKYVF